MSRYLRDLNTVKEPGSAEENFTFEDDLAMFTNTQFFDFETGQHTDYQAPPKKAETATVAEPQAPSSAVTEELTSPIGDFGNVDFSLPGKKMFSSCLLGIWCTSSFLFILGCMGLCGIWYGFLVVHQKFWPSHITSSFSLLITMLITHTLLFPFNHLPRYRQLWAQSLWHRANGKRTTIHIVHT